MLGITVSIEQFIKFGFGRALRDASRQVVRGRLTREAALERALRLTVQGHSGAVPPEFRPPEEPGQKSSASPAK